MSSIVLTALPAGVLRLAVLVIMVPGGAARAMRLNFSNAAPDRIVEGIALLGEALGRVLGG